ANTPVLCSDIAVFREVAGELADYFDPFSVESICASVTRVLSRQDEWRRKNPGRDAGLAARLRHQNPARDLLAHQAGPGSAGARASRPMGAGRKRVAAGKWRAPRMPAKPVSPPAGAARAPWPRSLAPR